jgi:hypothetical protein
MVTRSEINKISTFYIQVAEAWFIRRTMVKFSSHEFNKCNCTLSYETNPFDELNSSKPFYSSWWDG